MASPWFHGHPARVTGVAVLLVVRTIAAPSAAPPVDRGRVEAQAPSPPPTAPWNGCVEPAAPTRRFESGLLGGAGDAAPGTAAEASTAHLAVVATISDGVVAPGRRLSVTFDVTPAPGVHVYAPGAHGYRVIAFCVDGAPWLTVHPANYPPAELYHFVPLDERVETYRRPFTLRQDVTIAATADALTHLAGRTSVVVRGRLEYQACNDTVCFPPASVPIAFTLAVTPMLRRE